MHDAYGLTDSRPTENTTICWVKDPSGDQIENNDYQFEENLVKNNLQH